MSDEEFSREELELIYGEPLTLRGWVKEALFITVWSIVDLRAEWLWKRKVRRQRMLLERQAILQKKLLIEEKTVLIQKEIGNPWVEVFLEMKNDVK